MQDLETMVYSVCSSTTKKNKLAVNGKANVVTHVIYVAMCGALRYTSTWYFNVNGRLASRGISPRGHRGNITNKDSTSGRLTPVG